jgi:hypothetical protein
MTLRATGDKDMCAVDISLFSVDISVSSSAFFPN